MTYSEKINLEVEKAARIAIHNEYDTLKGETSRIFVNNDMSELVTMYDCAKKSIDRIYEYHLAWVKEF